ncbi:hypothetical protein [Alicyclobacillus vulcanalis]|uniref:Uncharacterized protein n=1 Tax=Alicyclobacillus vulcanalis TaxID=252246 RepID=A0A1N7MQL3_9BACL|nr:hypothetical protein [Alicyclobacillus vulcanalis]SIS88425.1 hypothetical protein SAMN05421799_10635 [Alicyclobacillus vulcanalis]
MAYYKHPVIDGDGEMSITMPDGTVKTIPIVEGVVDWPDGVPVHSRFEPAPEPEAMRELKRKQKEEELRRLAAELGVTVQFANDGSDAEPKRMTKGRTATTKADE